MAVILVCGPPCAGKTTFVLSQALSDDLIVDHDLLAQDFGSPVTHGHGRGVRNMAERRVKTYLHEIRAGQHANAWVVRTMPFVGRRAAFAEELGADDVVLIDPGIDVCKKRALERPNPTTTVHLINRWYARASVRSTP